MKKAKYLMMLFAAIILTTTFAACGDDDDDNDTQDVSIFGTWQVTSLSYWDISSAQMVKKTFDDSDYEIITLTENSFKEEIFEKGELTNTITETLTTVGDLTAVQADGVTGTRVGYTMDPTGEVSQIVLFKDNNSKKFQCKRKNN